MVTVACRAQGNGSDTLKDSDNDTGSIDSGEETDSDTETGDTQVETGDTTVDTDTAIETGETADTQETDDTAETGDTAPDVVRTPITIDVETQADAKLVGEEGEALLGLRIGRVGDLNGDGYDEVVIGAPDHNDYFGRAYLLYGPSIASHTLSDADPHWDSTWGLESTDHESFGSAVHGAGDLNGDGIDDLLIGAFGYQTEDENPGRVAVLYGPPSTETDIDLAADAFIVGDWVSNWYASDSATGSSVDAAGDVDGDGNDDIVITAQYFDLDGAAYLVSGPVTGNLDLTTDWTFRVTETGQGAISSAGDTNGDGLDDLILGAQSDTPAATVFLGPATGDNLHADADVSIDAPSGAVAGDIPCGVGDVDGDGYDDVIVEHPTNSTVADHGGAVWLFNGPLDASESYATADAGMYGTEVDGIAGATTDAAGDVNADGFDDILIGAFTRSTYAPGRAYLVLGPVYGTLLLDGADVTFAGSGNDFVGTAVSGAGDIDGDGRADLLLGGDGDDDGGTDAGAVWLMLGKNL